MLDTHKLLSSIRFLLLAARCMVLASLAVDFSLLKGFSQRLGHRAVDYREGISHTMGEY